MKTKTVIYALSTLALAGTLIFTGCKKRKAFKEENGQTSADAKLAQGENDAAMNDANSVLGNSSYAILGGKVSSTAGTNTITICGLTIDTTGMYTGTVKLNYNGTVCNNRKREGSIRLTILNHSSGVRWKTPGCVLKVDYLSYKMTRASDGKSIQLDGTQMVTNVSGGNWGNLILGQPNLVTTVTGNDLLATFDDGKTATYNINRKFTYTFVLSTFVFTCVGEGIGSHNGIGNLENYGTTRDGDDFTSEVTTPIVWNTYCGAYAPIQGGVTIKVADKDFDLKATFGVDASGNSVTVAPNTCAQGFKVEWTYKKRTNKKIFAYT